MAHAAFLCSIQSMASYWKISIATFHRHLINSSRAATDADQKQTSSSKRESHVCSTLDTRYLTSSSYFTFSFMFSHRRCSLADLFAFYRVCFWNNFKYYKTNTDDDHELDLQSMRREGKREIKEFQALGIEWMSRYCLCIIFYWMCMFDN